MTQHSEHHFQTANGYMTEITRTKYIDAAIKTGVLPKDAHRIPEIVSLIAPQSPTTPIQFWQIFSLLGPEQIVAVVQDFYTRVFADEDWFTAPFKRVGPLNHHINTQASMWADVMGGGPYYHGAEFRLNFHHTHNALELMTERGAKRWVALMNQTLDASPVLAADPRLRPSFNTFLSHFLGKYAEDFAFKNVETFGASNPPWRRKINFMNMTTDAIEAMSEEELRQGLEGRGVYVSALAQKADLVRKAQEI